MTKPQEELQGVRASDGFKDADEGVPRMCSIWLIDTGHLASLPSPPH